MGWLFLSAFKLANGTDQTVQTGIKSRLRQGQVDPLEPGSGRSEKRSGGKKQVGRLQPGQPFGFLQVQPAHVDPTQVGSLKVRDAKLRQFMAHRFGKKSLVAGEGGEQGLVPGFALFVGGLAGDGSEVVGAVDPGAAFRVLVPAAQLAVGMIRLAVARPARLNVLLGAVQITQWSATS
jgi:hypothetical protein